MRVLSAWRSISAGVIATALAMSLALPQAWGQKGNSSKAAVPRFSLSMQLISDTGDLDASPYLDEVQKLVKDKAAATLPRSVGRGEQGIAIIRFEIQKDGSVASKTPPKFIFPSGKKELDDHAMSAITAAAPFSPLPEPINDRNMTLQFTFYYNMSATQPQ